MFKRTKYLPFLSKDAHLEVEFENDILTLQGTPQESVGCVLRGAVVLTVNNPLKVKSIWAKLIGRVTLNESDNISCRQHIIVLKQLHFLKPEEGIHTLMNHQYRYPFELALDGSTPESTNLPFGRIEYQMIAVVERPGIRFDLKTRRTLEVLRNYSPHHHDALMYPSETEGTWEGRFQYRISVSEPTLVINQNNPISLDLNSLTNDLDIQKIEFRLTETTHYSGPGGSWDFRTQEHSLKSTKFGDFRSAVAGQEGAHKFQPELILPSGVYPTLNTEYIQVKHDLCILFTMRDKLHGTKLILQKDLPVIVRSSEQISLDISPPRYQPICSYVSLPPPSYTPTPIST
ncbi:hypothetical protein K7432_007607 [Basidiobolus ranarum]|uniref:Arrestin-like N-terminal domain-containing protein n=1 Tax=Basidiobolus ranarum TaxID=34480 RepID=A0ABR2WT63_9FUNG